MCTNKEKKNDEGSVKKGVIENLIVQAINQMKIYEVLPS